MPRTDEELVALSIGGDVESFNQLVLRWERPIFALAYRVIGREEEARDVVQETFLRAFRGIGNFRGQAKFSSWVYRIALNLCRDWMRRERRLVGPFGDATATQRGYVLIVEPSSRRRAAVAALERWLLQQAGVAA